MCGRFTQERPASELAEIFGAEPLVDDPGGHYNVAPTDEALVVVQRDDRRAVTAYRWGLIPHWATAAKVGSRMINARAETLTASPAFRDAFVRKRCLVPVDSFYEWKRDGKTKRPFKIHLADEPIMSLAGVWDTWRPGSKHERSSFSILTTAANAFMREIHDRMPVILGRADEEEWLDPEVHEQSVLQRMFKPCPSEWLTAVEVSPLVNSAKNNSPEVLEPASADEAARTSQRRLFEV